MHRVAVIGGAGTWGSRYLSAFARHPSCRIAALIDRSRERRSAFAGRYSVEADFSSVDEYLSRETPEIAAVVLPVAESRDTVIACARAGVKVIACEKPIAVGLDDADRMIESCERADAILSCGSVYANTPFLLETAEWIRAGNIGTLVAAAIPGGLRDEASGGGCVELTALRLLSGMDVEWVEGFTLPSDPSYQVQGVSETQLDRPAYGRLGLWGGIVCEIARPDSKKESACQVSIIGESGRAWVGVRPPILVQGKGSLEAPVNPDFLAADPPDPFDLRAERLVQMFESGTDPMDSANGYRHALEAAIALMLSADRGHERISLPLADRSLRIYPHPYRLHGGDVAGWESIGLDGPPRVD
jgi:predicted dehydrogenase